MGALRGDLTQPSGSDWVRVGVVTSLYIYPVKSLAAVKVQSFSAQQAGAVEGALVDRQFMVTDSKGKMVTSRRYPNMAKITPHVSSEEIKLSYPGQQNCVAKIPRDDHSSAGIAGDVWGEVCQGVPLSPSSGSWLSSIILGNPGGGLQLLYHNLSESSRPDREEDSYLTPLVKAGDKPLYADGYPFLLVSDKSVEGLNRTLEEKLGPEQLVVEEQRFRPNIYISLDSGEPFAEDKWSHVKIGETTVFRNIKPCTRCVFTTVDPFKGEKHPKGEPLKTLREFRSTEDATEKKAYGTSPFFGVNLGIEIQGHVSIGDVVFAPKNNLNS